MSWGPGTHQGAVDEIDRLTAEVERYRKARNHPDDNDCCVSFMEENARLRTALEQIINGENTTSLDFAQFIARKALANEQKP